MAKPSIPTIYYHISTRRIRCSGHLYTITRRSLINSSPSPNPKTRSFSSTPQVLSLTSQRSFHTSPHSMKTIKNIPPRNSKEPVPPLYLREDPPPYCHTCGRVMKPSLADFAETERKYCSGGCRRRKPRRRDMEIEETFVKFLNDTRSSSGGERKLVSCDDVEQFIFGDVEDMVKAEGDKRPSGEIRAKQREQVRQAARRGVVFGFVKYNGLAKWPKCEVVQKGMVVDPSYAKGDFSIRWRE